MAKISIYAWSAKRDQDGTLPLYLRIAHKNATRYVTLGLRVAERHWNVQAEQIRKSHPDHARLNNYLLASAADAQHILADMLANRAPITAQAIKQRMKVQLGEEEPAAPGDFLAYCEGRLDDYFRRGQISTWKVYRTAARKLRDYVRDREGVEQLIFDDITLPFMRGLQTYMIDDLENAPNTVHKSMSALHTMLGSAIKEGLFPWEKDPFHHITLRKERPNKDRLTLDEIKAIEGVELSSGSLIWDVRNWFLFAFYAGGMRFSDVATVQWKHISRQGDDVLINFKMQKTRDGHSTLLVKSACEILDYYADRSANRDATLFGILDGYDTSTPALLRSAIESRNALANKYLKKLQRMAGLDADLTFHLARHSLADYLRKRGFSLYDISKVLGHANTRVTEQYLRGFDRDDLNEKMRQVF